MNKRQQTTYLGRTLRIASAAGAGALALILGGAPWLVARRILYPAQLEPQQLGGELVPGPEIEGLIENVTINSRSGGTLGGWFVPAPPDVPKPWPCVLLVYGYAGCKEQMLGYARNLYSGGFASLMFDMRGSGSRRGEPVSLGYKERWDLMDAANYARSRGDVDPERLGVLGVSMGGATSLLAAAEEPTIKALVIDSAFAAIGDMVKPGISAFIGRYALPLSGLIVRCAEIMIGVKADEIKPEIAAAELGRRPIFVIHGAADSLISLDSAHRIFAAAPGPKELWIVPECDHAQAPAVAVHEYTQRVNAFFDKWLNSEGDVVLRTA